MARVDIFYLKKISDHKFEEIFFGQFFAEFTHNGTTSSTYDWGNHCLARDSSDKLGQDRIVLTRLRYFVAKKCRKISNLDSNLKHFCTAHAELNQGIQGWILNAILVNIYSSENKEGDFFQFLNKRNRIKDLCG